MGNLKTIAIFHITFVCHAYIYNRFSYAFTASHITFSFFIPANPVCGGQAGVQQVPYKGRPSLAVPLHLSVVHRQLWLR